MWLKIIRTNNSSIGHAILYAGSDNKNDYYLNEFGDTVTSLKLDYNRNDAHNILFPYDAKHDAPTILYNPSSEELFLIK